MCDICFINAGGHKKKVYQSLSDDFSACEPPFWAALTAGYIRSKGFLVDLIDSNGLNIDFNETIDRVREKKPRYACIVVYSQQANCSSPIMVSINQLSREIKDRIPDQKVIISGWHPSTLPEQTMLETGADYVVQGEGFQVILELLQRKDHDAIPGLWARDKKGVPRAPLSPMPNIPDLTIELDEIAWDLVPWTQASYRAFNWMCLADFSKRNHYVSMFTSLGCPFRCEFCGIHATYGDRKIRYWSPEWVLKQLDILVNQYNVYHINLVDELFIFNREHYLAIAEGIIEREYRLNICAFVSVDAVQRISDQELATLKRAGFNWFKIGIESPNAKNLKSVNKARYSKEVIKEVIDRIHGAGIDMCANYMFGFEDDTFDTMQENLEFAMQLNCVFPSFFCLMAVPGSDLYRHIKNSTPDALPNSWVGYAQQGYEFKPLPTKHLTSEQVLEFRDYAFKAYFDNPRYLHMIEKKFGKQARDHIVEMNRIKLKRKLLRD